MNLPTPVGLLQEKGVIGEILRQLPRMVLAESEQQGKRMLASKAQLRGSCLNLSDGDLIQCLGPRGRNAVVSKPPQIQQLNDLLLRLAD